MDIHDLSPQGEALVTQNQVHAGMRRWAAGGEAESELSWRGYALPIDLTPDGRALLFAARHGVQRRRVNEQRHVFQDRRRIGCGAGAGWLCQCLATGLPGVIEARWLRNGDSVLLMATDAQGKARFHRLDLGRGVPSPAFAASASFTCDSLRVPWAAFRISPDDRLVAVSGADGRILLVPFDGGVPRPMPGARSTSSRCSGAPTDFLYCYRRGELPARMFEVDVARGRRSVWATIRPPGIATTEIVLFLSYDLRIGVYGYDDISSDLYLVDGLR